VHCLVGFLGVCALVATLPQSASAQAGEEVATSEPRLREPAPLPEPASEYSLDLWQWHDEALTIALFSSSPTFEGYDSARHSSDPYINQLEAMELRVKRARIGLGVSVVAMVGGGGLLFYGLVAEGVESGATAAFGTGLAVYLGGIGGTIASGVLLRRRKHDRDRLRAAYYGTPRRVQWDLAQSRLVF